MIEFLAANWLWIVIAGVFVWMHTRRGGCGMHSGHGDHDQREAPHEASRPPDVPRISS